jgi:hypothetical protein
MDMWLPAKGNWLLGSIGGITTAEELAIFLLGAITISPVSRLEASAEEDLEAGRQELGRGKQRRLKVQFLWDILGPDTVSKSAQSSPGSYFRNPSMPRGHSAVIPNNWWAISSLGRQSSK